MLPNQRPAFCTHPAEVPVLYKQIGPYFRHGITLEADDVVFDVGANIGLFCAMAAAWGERPLRGFAFEPMPTVFEALQRNLARYAPGVQALRCAVSDQPGTLDMQFFPRATVLSTAYGGELQSAATRHAIADQLHRLPRRWRWLARWPQGLRRALVRVGMGLFLRPRQLRCAMRTVSSVIDEFQVPRIDLLKIDAERAELDVLNGITEAHWPLIRQVVMEVHDLDGRLARIDSLLRQHGFAPPVVAQSAELKDFGIYQLWARRAP